MYNIIPLILILVSIVVIVVIIVRKFPVLANLDIENVPAEKEAKFKEQIISNRFKRNFSRFSAKFLKFAGILGVKTGNFSKVIYNKLLNLKDSYEEESVEFDGENETVDRLWEKFDNIDSDDVDAREKTLIDIIGADSRNLEAFKKLGALYFVAKKYNEAEETFKHILKLIEGSEIEDGEAEIYFNLSLIYKETGDLDSSLEAIERALKLEENNPRYLDTSLEISIMNKDKAFALDAYNKLKKVNPDNQKLDEIKEKINEL